MRAGSDVEVAISAVDAACELIRRSYGGAVKRFDKGDRDFATGVDLAAESVIRTVLRKACPRDVFLGEEYGANPGDGSRTWLVDRCAAPSTTRRNATDRGRHRPAY